MWSHYYLPLTVHACPPDISSKAMGTEGAQKGYEHVQAETPMDLITNWPIAVKQYLR